MTASDQLPAVIEPTAVANPTDTYIVPALIAEFGNQAGWRYVEFFTANIRNPHTRRAYARARGQFFAWCEQRGLTLAAIQLLAAGASAPSVKQQLAAVRMLCDWLVVGQVLPNNPAAAVRGPKHVVKTGSTPVLEGEEWRKLLDSIPATTLEDLRDRALIATLTYSFARISAALKMKVEDLRPRGAGWTIRLHEKGGKQHAMPCHHAPRRGAACLYQRGWHRRRSQRLPVPHRARTQRHRALRQTDEPARRLADDPPPRDRGRDRGGNWVP
jgi:integrase